MPVARCCPASTCGSSTRPTRSNAWRRRRRQARVVVPLLPAGMYSATASLPGFKKDVVKDLRLEAGGKGNLDLVLIAGSVRGVDCRQCRCRPAADGRQHARRIVRRTRAGDDAGREPGLPPVHLSVARRGDARAWVEALHQAQRRRERIGRPRGGEQLPARRRGQQRPVPQPAGGDAQPRCDPGVHARPEHLRRRVRPQQRRAGERRHASPAAAARAGRCSSTGATRRSTREACSTRPTSPRRCSGGTSSAARSAGRSPASRSFYFASAEGLWTRSAETRVAHVPTARERAGDFSAQRHRAARSAHRCGVPGQSDSRRASRSRRGERGGAVSGSEPRGSPTQNLVSSPAGSRDGLQLTVKTDHHAWRETPLFLRYSLTADDREQPFPARGRNLPGFGSSVVDVGHNAAAGASLVLPHGLFNEVRIGWNRLRRENAPLARRAGRVRRAGDHRARRCRRQTSGTRPSSWPATKRSATIRTCRCRGARRRSTSATA